MIFLDKRKLNCNGTVSNTKKTGFLWAIKVLLEIQQFLTLGDIERFLGVDCHPLAEVLRPYYT